jgi:UDP-GlcNAc:undecaprenyl-phosphate GlcNAc-1-phosphate transferase
VSAVPTHPSLEYLLVAAIAGAGSFVLTPVARAVAVKWGAIARPRDRDVHAVAIPRLGGVAMFGGFALAIFVAAQLPTLRDTFSSGPELPWVLAAGAIICVLGMLDDRYELDSVTKLAGQVLATAVMVTRGGVQLAEIFLPWNESTLSLSRDIAIPATILFTVLTINAMNFIDGLDGLAAGVAAIGALAFFLYSYHLAQLHRIDVAAAPLLLTAALVGTCVGFLPHNFFPARIFMGDSGSMLIGLMLSAGATTATTSADPQGFGGAIGFLPLVLPLLIVLAVLAIPFVDLLLAIVRRVARGQSPFAPDKQHLHHRLLRLGHSHRRAVLLMWLWSALLAIGFTTYTILRANAVLFAMLGCGIAAALAIVVTPRVQKTRPPAAPATPTSPPGGSAGMAQRGRSIAGPASRR